MPHSEESRDDSDAAQYNRRVLKKLQRAFATQPDLDLTLALPSHYRSRLASKKQCPGRDAETVYEPGPSQPQNTPFPAFNKTHLARVLHPLSATVESLLSQQEPEWMNDGHRLSHAISEVLRSATILFQSATDCNHYVVRCSEHIVMKAISEPDSTEYTTLQFLDSNKPAFPAPKPHGVVVASDVWYMFMSYIPGVSLDKIWPNLLENQKECLSRDLNSILLELHEIPYQSGTMLGGVAGQGCKDVRRHKRTAKHHLYTCDDVWKFMYGCARNRDTVYGKFLYAQTFPPRRQMIHFIHGDLRPANVIVQPHSDGSIHITGLIDWEMSGFYPEDLECVRAMNNLSPIGDNDWYLHLPACLSPKMHLDSWHADWVWDPYVV